MFIKARNVMRENLLLNADNIEVILQQEDGDVFVHMRSGQSYKLAPSCYEELMVKLGD